MICGGVGSGGRISFGTKVSATSSSSSISISSLESTEVSMLAPDVTFSGVTSNTLSITLKSLLECSSSPVRELVSFLSLEADLETRRMIYKREYHNPLLVYEYNGVVKLRVLHKGSMFKNIHATGQYLW